MKAFSVIQKNNLIEGTMTNIFFIKENILFTPKITKGELRYYETSRN